MEVWTDVPGWPSYEVSTMGRVRSKKNKKILSLDPSTHGYPRVQLCHNGERTRIKVHKLVLTAFVRPRYLWEECRHLNGVKTDNRLCNLAWGAPEENEADKLAHGTYAVNRMFNRDQVVSIRRKHTSGASLKNLSREYGCSIDTIRNIVRHRSYTVWPEDHGDNNQVAA